MDRRGTGCRRQSRQADLRRQPRLAGRRGATTAAIVSFRATSAIATSWPGCWTSIDRGPWSTSRPSRTSTVRSTAPPSSSRPTWSAAFACWKLSGDTGSDWTGARHVSSAFCTSRPTRCYGSLGPSGQVHRDHAVRAQLALLGLEGRLRSFCAGLSPHLWAADADHQLLEQLRALPVSRKADPADDPQRARGQAAAGLRRRAEGPRLAVRRGPLPGHSPGAGRGDAGRNLQHRRQLRADEPVDRRGDLRRRRSARSAAIGAQSRTR